MPNGVLYIATGEEYRREAGISAQSVKESMPSTKIGIITDSKPNNDIFDDKIIVNNPDYSFKDQIHYLPDSPYDRTIYMDTDIYLNNSIDDLFTVLNQFDIGIAHAQGGTSWDIEGVPPSFPEYNSGVVAYKTNGISDFCKDWLDNYTEIKQNRPQNQPSLRKTLYESDLRIATLPREYNCMYRQPGHVNSRIKVFHGRLIDVEGPGAGLYHDPADAMAKLNRSDQSRVFTQLGGLRVYSNRTDSLLHRTRLSIRQKGLSHTFERGIKKLFSRIK